LSRRSETWAVVMGGAATCAAVLALMLTQVRCDYSSDRIADRPGGSYDPGLAKIPAEAPSRGGAGGTTATTSPAPDALVEAHTAEEKAAILDNIVRLIESASLKPGGKNFGNATRNLNQFFAGTPASEYALPPAARVFLLAQPIMAKERVDELESPTWTLADARHLEDCILYRSIARRVGGETSDDVTPVRRIFDWMVRNVQLVPPGALGKVDRTPVFARPYDVLVRGMASESEGVGAERGWLFVALCRQLGLDVGLITYTPPGAKGPIAWCEAVLIDKKLYLFDARVGIPIPDARGDGVATLDEAMTNPRILDRMDLPGQSPYGTTAAILNASPSKIGILIDSSNRYFAPRMKLLQNSLAGKNLTVLYRDPAEQRDRWVEALGPHAGQVALWELPMVVETLLFKDPRFVEVTQRSQVMFRPEFPLLYARMKQLRGELAGAVQDYVNLRFKENATMLNERKTPIPPEVQQALDAYATYFLGMCKLDQNDPKSATGFFERTLEMLPEPGPSQPYYAMYRWGAQTNLGLLKQAQGDTSRAIAYFTQKDPTSQRHGNLFRARDLLWLDPLAPCPVPLPPAPPPIPEPGPRPPSPPVDSAS
jgi:hypothetical protein